MPTRRFPPPLSGENIRPQFDSIWASFMHNKTPNLKRLLRYFKRFWKKVRNIEIRNIRGYWIDIPTILWIFNSLGSIFVLFWVKRHPNHARGTHLFHAPAICFPSHCYEFFLKSTLRNAPSFNVAAASAEIFKNGFGLYNGIYTFLGTLVVYF